MGVLSEKQNIDEAKTASTLQYLKAFNMCSYFPAPPDAIIGIDGSSMRLIYSISKCIQILSKDMSEEDAIEYFEYNVSGSYVGEKTPIWCIDNL